MEYHGNDKKTYKLLVLVFWDSSVIWNPEHWKMVVPTSRRCDIIMELCTLFCIIIGGICIIYYFVAVPESFDTTNSNDTTFENNNRSNAIVNIDMRILRRNEPYFAY